MIKYHSSLSNCLIKFQRGETHMEKDYSRLTAETETNSWSTCPIVNLFKIPKSRGSKKCLMSWATQASSYHLIL